MYWPEWACFLYFSFVHTLLSNISSIYYSTWRTTWTLQFYRNTAEMGAHAQAVNTRLLFSSHVAWLRGYSAGWVGQSHGAGTLLSSPIAISVLLHGQVIITPLSTVHQSATPTNTVTLEGSRGNLSFLDRKSVWAWSLKCCWKLLVVLRKTWKHWLSTMLILSVLINMQEKLKLLIRMQLQNDVSGDYDVVYLQGSTVSNIRSSEELDKVRNDIRKRRNVALWCDGLKQMTSKT